MQLELILRERGGRHGTAFWNLLFVLLVLLALSKDSGVDAASVEEETKEAPLVVGNHELHHGEPHDNHHINHHANHHANHHGVGAFLGALLGGPILLNNIDGMEETNEVVNTTTIGNHELHHGEPHDNHHTNHHANHHRSDALLGGPVNANDEDGIRPFPLLACSIIAVAALGMAVVRYRRRNGYETIPSQTFSLEV